MAERGPVFPRPPPSASHSLSGPPRATPRHLYSPPRFPSFPSSSLPFFGLSSPPLKHTLRVFPPPCLRVPFSLSRSLSLSFFPSLPLFPSSALHGVTFIPSKGDARPRRDARRLCRLPTGLPRHVVPPARARTLCRGKYLCRCIVSLLRRPHGIPLARGCDRYSCRCNCQSYTPSI